MWQSWKGSWVEIRKHLGGRESIRRLWEIHELSCWESCNSPGRSNSQATQDPIMSPQEGEKNVTEVKKGCDRTVSALTMHHAWFPFLQDTWKNKAVKKHTEATEPGEGLLRPGCPRGASQFLPSFQKWAPFFQDKAPQLQVLQCKLLDLSRPIKPHPNPFPCRLNNHHDAPPTANTHACSGLLYMFYKQIPPKL